MTYPTQTEEINQWIAEQGSERDALNVALASLRAAEGSRDDYSSMCDQLYGMVVSRTETIDALQVDRDGLRAQVARLTWALEKIGSRDICDCFSSVAFGQEQKFIGCGAFHGAYDGEYCSRCDALSVLAPSSAALGRVWQAMLAEHEEVKKFMLEITAIGFKNIYGTLSNAADDASAALREAGL